MDDDALQGNVWIAEWLPGNVWMMNDHRAMHGWLIITGQCMDG